MYKCRRKISVFLAIVMLLSLVLTPGIAHGYPAYADAAQENPIPTAFSAQGVQIHPDHLIWRLVSFSGTNGTPASRHAAFEIYNPTNRRINLSGYSVRYQDTSNNWTLALPASATILPGGSFLIRGANNNGDGRWDNRNTPFDLQTPAGHGLRSSNSSNQIHLYDPTGDRVASATIVSSNNDDVLYNRTLQADAYFTERRGIGSDAGGMNRIPRALVNGSWGAHNPVVRNELIGLIAVAEAQNEADWDAGNWQNLTNALTAARFARDTTNIVHVDQTDIDAASEQIIEALASQDPSFINNSGLVRAIEQAQARESSNYTRSSWEPVALALSSAIAVASDVNATQAEINAARDNLNAALAALVRVTPFIIPDTEVKFLIDPALVLDANGNLRPQVANLFGGFGRDRGRSINMQFMDTPEQAFNAYGFINRIRYRHWNQQDGEGYQITYRKRIPVWPVNHANIQAAIDRAHAEGFGNWDMGLDWSYNSAVLTLSYTVATGGRVPSTLPDVTGSRILLINHMPAHVAALYTPEQLEAFNNVVIHGPAAFRRYEFNFPGTSDRILRIEVLPIRSIDGTGIDHIVEVSFEFENEGRLEVLSQHRAHIQGILENAGILVPESGLRASTILARYRR